MLVVDDYIVKFWDFIVGKMMFEFFGYMGFVNVVEFYFNEYFLVFGSFDRIICFWDLEKF